MGNSSSAITNTVTNNDSELAERPLKRLKVSSSLFVEGSDLENQTTSIALPPGKICWFVGGILCHAHLLIYFTVT